MTDRSLKIYQGEDLSPVTDLTDMAIWEDAEFGTRAWRGEAINSNVTIRDPDAVTGQPISLPGGLTPISLSAGNVLEYVHGSNVRWRGRMASKDYSRGDQRANRYREAACYLEDVNIDMRGIVVHGWARPAETDVARVQAAIAHYGRGGAAGRPSTVINGSNLVSGSNLVNLTAKTYVKTDLQGVFEEIATEANKTFFLRPRRFTSDSHTAEMVYDGTDALIERCPFKITDRPAEVKADPFAFFPIWNVGPAATENGQELISGVWLFYGSSDNDYVHVSDPVQASEYIKREVVVYDDTITTAAQATRKANAILAFRAYEERTINVTIGPLNDAQLGSIRVGQTIAIKARAITFADDLYYDGKISQLKETSPTPGTYFVHLQLDRPWRMGAHGNGSPIKGPDAPTPGTPGTPATELYRWSFAAGMEDDTATYAFTNGGLGTGWDAAGYAYNGSVATGPLQLVEGDYIPVTAGVTYQFAARIGNRGSGTGTIRLEVEWFNSDPNSLSSDVVGSTTGTGFIAVSGTATAPVGATQASLIVSRSGGPHNNLQADDIVVALDDAVAAVPDSHAIPPLANDGEGTVGDDGDTFSPIDHAHEHGDLSDTSENPGPHHHITQIVGFEASESSSLGWFNITDHGALIDGTTDDTAAVQAAVDAAIAAGGGVVYHPGGTCNLTAQIDVDPGSAIKVTFLGTNFYASVYEQVTADTSGFVLNTNAQGSLFENVRVIGNSTTSGDGIYAPAFVHLHRVIMGGFYDDLRCGSSNWHSRVTDSFLEGAARAGIRLDDGSNNFTAIGTKVGSSPNGVYVAGTEGFRFIGGTVEQCTTYGIRIDSGTNNTGGVLISGNYFEQASGTDIGIGVVNDTVRGGVIEANKFTDGVTRHIDIRYAEAFTIGGNDFRDTGETVRVQSDAVDILMLPNRNDGSYSLAAGTTTVIPDDIGSGDAADISITDSGGYYTGTDVEAALQEVGADLAAAGAAGLIPVDVGTVTYDTSGTGVAVEVATVWGIDGSTPYYDATGAVAGEEAVLYFDPTTGTYSLIPYDF